MSPTSFPSLKRDCKKPCSSAATRCISASISVLRSRQSPTLKLLKPMLEHHHVCALVKNDCCPSEQLLTNDGAAPELTLTMRPPFSTSGKKALVTRCTPYMFTAHNIQTLYEKQNTCERRARSNSPSRMVLASPGPTPALLTIP